MIKGLADKIRTQINKTVVHQEQLTEQALTAFFSGGHVLMEGVPGLAKTLWVRSLAQLLNMPYRCAQFTTDLTPSDLMGTNIVDSHLFVADGIDRASPKTQSALLAIIEESRITLDSETFLPKEPFFVIATQNPMEYENTYPLTASLTDRFMMKLTVTYPGVAAEKRILQMHHKGFGSLTPICNAEDITLARSQVQAVGVDDGIMNYIVSIVETTRRIGAVICGASPRGSIALLIASKTYAAIQGRDFVIPEDVRFLAAPVLRHRILIKPEAEVDGMTPDQVVENILTQVKTPR